MKLPLSDDDLQRIRDALFQGRKIEAIKIYRGATLTGLAEAKSAVEQYEVELRISTPQTFQKPVPPPGTAGLRHATVVLPDEPARADVVAAVESAGLPVDDQDGEPLVHDPSGNAFVVAVS